MTETQVSYIPTSQAKPSADEIIKNHDEWTNDCCEESVKYWVDKARILVDGAWKEHANKSESFARIIKKDPDTVVYIKMWEAKIWGRWLYYSTWIRETAAITGIWPKDKWGIYGDSYASSIEGTSFH